MTDPTLLPALLDSLKDPFLFADTEHVIRYMNAAAVAHYKEGAALLGRSLFDCHNTDLQRQMREILVELQAGVDERLITDNEKHRIYMRAVRDSAGRLLGYYKRYEPPTKIPAAAVTDRRSLPFQRTHSQAPWETQIGYCRAIRAGNLIYVTGTAPVAADGGVFAPGDAYAQARRCLEIIRRSLNQLGADLSHVVRTRMFVTDVTRWAEFGQAHREVFADCPPATTMVQVAALIHPDMLIEIEADAVCPPAE
jgi:enamine deaminase RidA (YjgF/YER057c/UK114 family)